MQVRAPNTPDPGPEMVLDGRCLHGELWLARDGYWYCSACEPARFQNEVLERRNQQELLTLWPARE